MAFDWKTGTKGGQSTNESEESDSSRKPDPGSKGS